MVYRSLHIGFLSLATSVLVAGCGPDIGTAPVQAPAKNPSQATSPPPTAPTIPSAPSADSPNGIPTVSGTPATSATVGSRYTFTPTASDADGDALVWSISDKPPAATFSTTTGALTWTPDTPGVWSNIRVSVTDSKGASASLATFSINVQAPAASGSAALSWTSPSQYTDGSPLLASDLTGFAIYSGTNADSLLRLAEVDGRTNSFIVDNLAPGTHYFAVTAIAVGGAESSFSAVGQKTIPTL